MEVSPLRPPSKPWPAGLLKEIATDESGDIFFSDIDLDGGSVPRDYGSERIRDNDELGSGILEPEGVAVDSSGNVFVGFTTNSSNPLIGSVGELLLRAADFGTVAIGTKTAAVSVAFTFDTGGTVGSPVALAQGAPGLDFAVASGGTCTAGTYSAGATCTVNVNFTPRFAGLRTGAVVLRNGSGVTIATAYVSGIGLGAQVSFLPGTQSTLGGGFTAPYGVAVDGSGNIFVADSGKRAVYEVPAGCAAASCVELFSSLTFFSPEGVAVDGGGNLFVADTSNPSVQEIPSGGGYTTETSLPEKFGEPSGVAVDRNGNVFVSSDFTNEVYEFTAVSGYATVNNLGPNINGSGFSDPQGLAADASGNIFAAYSGNNLPLEIPSGCAPASCAVQGSYGLNQPSGVVLDANGSLYVTDTGNSALKRIPSGCTGANCVVTLASDIDAEGIARDASGNLFVADAFVNHRVVKLDFADAPDLSFGWSRLAVVARSKR